MKIKDLERFIKETLNFKKFMSQYEDAEYTTKIHVYDKYMSHDYTSIKDLIKNFDKEFLGEINADTEIRNENGYITVTVKYQDKRWSEEKGIYFIDKQYDLHIAITFYANVYGSLIEESL